MGQISIPLSISGASFRNVKELFAIFIEDQWIAAKEHCFLWLPSDYRPTCTAVCGSLICLGNSSGHVIFLEFDFESMNL